MDLIIILVLLIVVLYLFKSFEAFVYFVASLDIFLRIIGFLKENIASPEIQKFINTHMPLSIPNVIGKYTTGVFSEVLMWLFVIIFIIFEIYIIKTLFRKR